MINHQQTLASILVSFVFAKRLLVDSGVLIPKHSSAVMANQSITPARTVQELLKQFNLHMNELEPVIICRTCHFALSGSVKSIVDHVEHKYPRDLAKSLSQLLRPYTILGPKELRL